MSQCFKKTNLHVCHLLGPNAPAMGPKANKYLSILCQGLYETGSREEWQRVGPTDLACHSLSWCVPPIWERPSDESSCLRSPLWEVADGQTDLVCSGPCLHFEQYCRQMKMYKETHLGFITAVIWCTLLPPHAIGLAARKKEFQRDFTGLLSLSISNSSVFNNQPSGQHNLCRSPGRHLSKRF